MHFRQSMKHLMQNITISSLVLKSNFCLINSKNLKTFSRVLDILIHLARFYCSISSNNNDIMQFSASATAHDVCVSQHQRLPWADNELCKVEIVLQKCHVIPY